MNGARKVMWTVLLIISIILMGCATLAPQIPASSLKPLPVDTEPKAPERHTKKLLDAQGKPAGVLFSIEDAFAEANYINDLKEWGRKGQANTVAANKVFEILSTPPKKWWQFWK